jgi:hypothetical protein
MIEVDPQEQAELERVLGALSTPQQAATPGRISLRVPGARNRQIAAEVGPSELAVGRWRTKVVHHGMFGLEDHPRSGPRRTIDDATIRQVVAKTLEPAPVADAFNGRTPEQPGSFRAGVAVRESS